MIWLGVALMLAGAALRWSETRDGSRAAGPVALAAAMALWASGAAARDRRLGAVAAALSCAAAVATWVPILRR